MKKYLFIVTSIRDAKKTLALLKTIGVKFDTIRIISSDPYSSIYLKNKGVEYTDIAEYYPPARSTKTMYKKISTILDAWYKKFAPDSKYNYLFRQIGFSLHNYLGDVVHSLETAKRIIEIEKPSKLCVTNYWSETPFRRYQTENFNLENLALIALSKKNGVAIFSLENRLSKSLVLHLFLFLRTLLLSSSNTSIKQIFQRVKFPTLKNLIVMANYYQLENLIPLLEKMKTIPIEFSLIGNANSSQVGILGKKGFDFYPVTNLENNAKKLFDVRLFKLITMCLLWMKCRNKLKNFFNNFDRNYWHFVSPKFLYYLFHEFPLISNLMDNSQIILRGKSALLTMATTDTISHSISYAAKLSRLKIVELQHGMLFMDVDKSHRFNDYYILWGNRAREIITNSKSDISKYPVAGFPLFDKYINNNFIKPKPIIKKGVHIESKTKTILILAVFPTGLARINQKISSFQFMKMIFQTINQLEGEWKIVFRPHPSFEADWVKTMAREYKINLYYDKGDSPIEDIIASSDVVIANLTTPILEAMFLKKPILTFLFHYDLGSEISNSFLVKSNATKIYSNKDELREYINLCLNNLKFKKRMLLGQRKFLQEYCMASSGSSSERIVKSLLGMIQI